MSRAYGRPARRPCATSSFRRSRRSCSRRSRASFAASWKLAALAETFGGTTGVGVQIRKAFQGFSVTDMMAWMMFFVIFVVRHRTGRADAVRALRLPLSAEEGRRCPALLRRATLTERTCRTARARPAERGARSSVPARRPDGPVDLAAAPARGVAARRRRSASTSRRRWRRSSSWSTSSGPPFGGGPVERLEQRAGPEPGDQPGANGASLLLLIVLIGVPIGYAMGRWWRVQAFFTDIVTVGLALPAFIWALLGGDVVRVREPGADLLRGRLGDAGADRARHAGVTRDPARAARHVRRVRRAASAHRCAT